MKKLYLKMKSLLIVLLCADCTNTKFYFATLTNATTFAVPKNKSSSKKMELGSNSNF
jgi:hypothetical protein